MSSEKTYWAGRTADPADDFGAVIRYTSSGGLEFAENLSSGTYVPLKNTLLGTVSSGNSQSFLNRKGEWVTLSGGQGISVSGGTVALDCTTGSAGAVLTLGSGGSSLQWKMPEVNSSVLSSSISSALTSVEIPDTLSDLDDVSTDGASSGTFLSYDGSAWAPSALPSASCYGSRIEGTGSGIVISGCSSLNGTYPLISGSGSGAVYICSGRTVSRTAEYPQHWEMTVSSGGTVSAAAVQTTGSELPWSGTWDKITVRRESAMYDLPLDAADQGKLLRAVSRGGSAAVETISAEELESRCFTIGSDGDFSSIGSAAVSAAGRVNTVEFVLKDDLCYGENGLRFTADNVRIVRDRLHEAAGTMPTLNGEFIFRDPRSVYISGVRITGNWHDPLTLEGGCRGCLDTVEINSALHAIIVKKDSFADLSSRVAILNDVETGITASAFGRVHAEKEQLINYAASASNPPYGSRGNEGGEVIHTPETEQPGFTISSGNSMVSAGFFLNNGIVSSGESMRIRSGGSMSGVQIQSGGSLTVLDGAEVKSTVLAGSMICSSGASASAVTGSSGSLLICSDGKASCFSGYGSICIQPGGRLQSGTILGGALTVSSGGHAFLVNVSSGTQITVYAGGELRDGDYRGGVYTSDFSGTEIVL